MPIYHGPGGAGDSTDDATITAVATLASQAATSATNAATSATTAETAATNAATSATNATAAVSQAQSYANNAAASASVALSAESSSELSASAAADSATTASSKASDAGTSATNAAISETNASSSAAAAATSATNAATSASNASTSAASALAIYGNTTAMNNAVTAASTSATNAATSASTASTQASNASTSATNAAASAASALTYSNNAQTSASNALSSANSASNSATSALSSYNSFHNQYQGAFSTAPTTRPDSTSLVTGDLYFDTTTNAMNIRSSSGGWLTAYTSVSSSGALVASNNLADLTNASTARTNIGLSNIQSVGGNIGIGTSSPSVRLDVQGGSINTSSFVTIIPSTVTNNALYRATNTGGTFFSGLDNSAGGVTGSAYAGMLWHTGAYPLVFATNATERMRIDSSGNVGIGTSSPVSTLDVTVSSATAYSATASGTAFRVANINSSAATNFSSMQLVTDGNGRGIVNLNALNNAAASSADFSIQTRHNGTLGERLRITSDGNVGIGTSSPNAPLSVIRSGSSGTTASFGNSATNNQGSNVAALNDTSVAVGLGVFGSAAGSAGMLTANSPFLGTSAAELNIYSSNASGVLKFATGGFTERMRLDSSGNLGIGVTPSAWDTSVKAFEVSRGSLVASTTELDVSHNAYFSSTGWKYIANGFATNHYQTNGTYVWRTAASGLAGATPSFTQAMTLDASGNLGIGTSSPSQKLEIAGTGSTTLSKITTTTGANALWSSSTGGNYFFGIDNSAGTFFGTAYGRVLYSDGAYPIIFYTNATEKMRLDSSGNLGLGVTPSAWGFSGNLELPATNNIAFQGSGNLLGNAYYSVASSGYLYKTTSGAVRYELANSQHRWYVAPSGTAGTAITFTQAMTLDANNNLMIGGTTTAFSSGYTFVNALGSNGGAFEVYSGTTRQAQFFCTSTTATLGTVASIPLIFNTANTERMRIDSSGNLLVGTTDTSNSTGPGIKLKPAGNGSNAPILAIVTTGSTGASANFQVYSTTAAAYRFYVTDAGQIYATSTSITGISDISLKENVRNLETGLTEVMALKPRRFDWKNGDATNVAGFIAQEVEEVLPELVSDYKYSDTETKKSLKMGDMLPTLVKAIQELKATVDLQSTEIASLKAQLNV